MTTALAGWLGDPALTPLWTAARRRLEGNGVVPEGRVTLEGLDRAGRHAVSGLVGRPVVHDRVRVDLAVLDAVLRERSGIGGLVAVLEQLDGPVRNRLAERSSQTAAREAPYVAARAWLGEHPEVAVESWPEDWLAGVRRSGVLSRVAGGGVAVRLVNALEISSGLLSAADAAPVARTELAAKATGDAHALDDGSVIGHLVLRALSVALGEAMPPTAGARRALWERVGVSADAVSSSCLTLGLRPRGNTSVARRLCDAADAGDPVHLTAWDLRRDGLVVADDNFVLVCENPRVLEAIAEARRGGVTVVCTSGMPGLVTLEVLRRLAAGGASLSYHGDFDWPGIAIANRLVDQVAVRPWRMTAADYRSGVHAEGPALTGTPVVPVWDESLGAAMLERGVALHEESVLETMVAALPPR